MSYAEAAAKGPKQTPAEAYVLLFPICLKCRTLTPSLVLHFTIIRALPASALADGHRTAPIPPQIERTEDVETSSTVDVNSMHVHSVPSNYSGETDTQMNRYEQEARQGEEEAKEGLRRAEEEARKDYKKGKSAATRKGKEARDVFANNRDNPVVLGNALIWAIVAGTLGFGAYQQHQAGKLDWKMGGIWAGAVGLFATGDYFVSQYLFKKYPPK